MPSPVFYRGCRAIPESLIAYYQIRQSRHGYQPLHHARQPSISREYAFTPSSLSSSFQQFSMTAVARHEPHNQYTFFLPYQTGCVCEGVRRRVRCVCGVRRQRRQERYFPSSTGEDTFLFSAFLIIITRCLFHHVITSLPQHATARSSLVIISRLSSAHIFLHHLPPSSLLISSRLSLR